MVFKLYRYRVVELNHYTNVYNYTDIVVSVELKVFKCERVMFPLFRAVFRRRFLAMVIKDV